ncbi:beta-1,3-galactosyltransferase 1-like [Lytechinus pictus]|uniref:beta-1,3-galactosyltransferase 1-like n=1 Tax=Lytechinus pictus TaxID=7653 RepID=UPI0030B9CDF3
MRAKISKCLYCLTLLAAAMSSWLGYSITKHNIRGSIPKPDREILRFENSKQKQLISDESVEAESISAKNHSKNLGVLAQHSWTPVSALHNYNYLQNNRLKCERAYTTVIAIVASAPGNFDRRNVIRMTWIQRAIEFKFAMKVMFILGETSDRSVGYRIKQEAYIHKDIIQEDFQDTYLNLTVKTIGALKWATQSCPRAKFFMKLDDDVVVNVGNLTWFLEKHVPSSNYLGGIPIFGARVYRDPTEKWYTPMEIYPNETYPPYTEGKAYVMSMDVAERIYNHSQTLQIFPWEDIFIGICAKHLNIVPQEIICFLERDLLKVRYEDKLVKSNKTLKNVRFLYVVYDLDVEEMIDVWRAWMSNSWG